MISRTQKSCGGPHATRRPVVGPHWLNQTIRLCSLLLTLCVACYICKLVEIYIWFSSDFWAGS